MDLFLSIGGFSWGVIRKMDILSHALYHAVMS